jgi:hypothetical protein
MLLPTPNAFARRAKALLRERPAALTHLRATEKRRPSADGLGATMNDKPIPRAHATRAFVSVFVIDMVVWAAEPFDLP